MTGLARELWDDYHAGPRDDPDRARDERLSARDDEGCRFILTEPDTGFCEGTDSILDVGLFVIHAAASGRRFHVALREDVGRAFDTGC